MYDNKRENLNAYVRTLLPGVEWKYDRKVYRGVIKSSAHDHHSYMYTYLPDVLIGTGTPAMILVNARAFDLSETTFNVILYSHESQHATDYYHGITLPDGTYISGKNIDEISHDVDTILFETRALRAELRSLTALGKTSSQRFSDVLDFVRFHAGRIGKAETKSKLDEKVLRMQEEHVKRTLQRYDPKS